MSQHIDDFIHSMTGVLSRRRQFKMHHVFLMRAAGRTIPCATFVFSLSHPASLNLIQVNQLARPHREIENAGQ
jgi:hypothetical protein